MKRKIKIKGLPKAQLGNVPPVVLTPQQQQQWYKNQNMFGTPPVGPTAFNNPFSVKQPEFITSGTKNPNPTKSLSPSGMGPITADDYYANLAEQNTAAPAGTRFDANAAYAPGTPMPSDINKSIPNISKNPFSMIGPMIMGELAFVNSAINKIDQRGAERKFKDQFLSDNMYLSRPESISGNRGDYDINTGMFRPDEYVYGKFNKIAQMGGEMKRKVKITGLPQAAYGGTQNKDAVNQLYGNSAYMMNMFSQRQEQEPMQEYNETLQADPRSLSVIEAEKGETLVKTGENSTIPEFYKIGGKRHYEGGTPLGPDKATPNSFIYSDTKAMRIKDPEILSSFGLKAKKGGYTPAEISKKFNLNDKNLREGLYDEQDMLRKKTAIMNADKYISNLGKLALVQESKKGFPQGIPDIAVPYMEKIGLDPMSFMPDQSQQNMMDNYGNLPMAQRGMSVVGQPLNQSSYSGQSMIPNTYYKQNVRPSAGIAIGPDGKPIKLREDIFGAFAPYSVGNTPDRRFNDKIVYGNMTQAELNKFWEDLENIPTVKQPVSIPQTAVKTKATPSSSAAPSASKPKQQTAAPSTGGSFTAPDGTVIDFEYGGIPMAQDGTQVNATGQILKTATDKSGNKFYSYLEGTDVVLRDESGKELQRRPATETDKPAIQTYTDEEKKTLKSIAPNIILPEDYVESLQTKGTAGTFGRFDKASADKNWGWYGKKLDYSNPSEVGAAMEKYNREMYNRFKNAGYTPQEAARYVNMIGFDPAIDKGPNALDKKAGKYFETRVLFDVPPKPKKEQAGPDVRSMDQSVDLSAKRPDRSRPIGLYPQDIVNTVGAMQNLYGINKQLPRQVQFTPEYIEPTYYDPTREIAANAEMANIVAQNLAQFTGPQAFNARYSDVQGKGLANAANIMGRYNNLNVGVANQFEMANKQLANEANFKNALFADDFYTKTAIANQQYDNARTQGRESVEKNIVGAMDNYFDTKLLNELYPQYYVDPSSLSVQYDPQAALKLRPKTQTGNLDARLESMFPGYTNLEEQDKNPLRIAMLKAFTGDTSDNKDAFAASAVRSKKK